MEFGNWPMMRRMSRVRIAPTTMPMRPPMAQRVVASMVRTGTEDVLFGGADGLADTDFPGSLGDGDEHDVHDTDAADHETDA